MALICVYYTLLVAGPKLSLFAPTTYGLLFNDMLDHLLQGRFDVSPDAVGMEGFLIDGKTYSYFGIFPALLRLPLMVFPGWRGINISQISLIVAYGLSAILLLRAVHDIWAKYRTAPGDDLLALVLGSVLVLGGPILQFLKPSVYQEVTAWAFLFTTIFLVSALRGCTSEQGFTAGLLARMGLVAGFALLTRVSFGLGLYCSLGLLLSVLFLQRRVRPVHFAMFFWPAVALATFALVTGGVNYGRWGSPFTFANFHAYLYNIQENFVSPSIRQGNFRIERIGCNFLYFFAPIFGLPGNGGQPWLKDTCYPNWEIMEAPPASFLITDPLLLFFAGSCLLRGRFMLKDWSATAIAAGLIVPPLLMLTFFTVTFRYRMEFYPLLIFLSLLDVLDRMRSRGPVPYITAGQRVLLVTCLAISVVTAHAQLALYRISGWGKLDGTYAEYYTKRIAELRGPPGRSPNP